MGYQSKWTPEQKIAIVMESLNTNISIAELCRKQNVTPNAFYGWKDKFLEAGKLALAGSPNSTNNGPSQELVSENEKIALQTAIMAQLRYERKYGDVKLSAFLVDMLAAALPELDHLERKAIFASIESKKLVTLSTKMDGFGNQFFVFKVDVDHPIVKKMIDSIASEARTNPVT